MTANPKRTSSPPRQLSQEKEEALIRAAKDIFFTKGVNSASMDEIAKRAGISKTTIYRRYSTKQQMFEALINDAFEQLAHHFDQLALDAQHPIASLNAAAHSIRKAAESSEFINVLRQLIAHAPHDPQFSQQACETMVATIPRGLTAFFKQLNAAGLMQHDYPEQAAATFFLICNRGFRPLFNALGTQKDENKRLDADLKMFIIGCQIKDPD